MTLWYDERSLTLLVGALVPTVGISWNSVQTFVLKLGLTRYEKLGCKFEQFCAEPIWFITKLRKNTKWCRFNKIMADECEHFSQAKEGIQPKTKGCEECKKEKTPWVALRQCLTCGHVGCCDSSVGLHATKHFEETGHPVMIALPTHSWKWCYVHKDYY